MTAATSVIRCWDQGKYDSLLDLENAIERENPAIWWSSSTMACSSFKPSPI